MGQSLLFKLVHAMTEKIMIIHILKFELQHKKYRDLIIFLVNANQEAGTI